MQTHSHSALVKTSLSKALRSASKWQTNVWHPQLNILLIWHRFLAFFSQRCSHILIKDEQLWVHFWNVLSITVYKPNSNSVSVTLLLHGDAVWVQINLERLPCIASATYNDKNESWLDVQCDGLYKSSTSQVCCVNFIPHRNGSLHQFCTLSSVHVLSMWKQLYNVSSGAGGRFQSLKK